MTHEIRLKDIKDLILFEDILRDNLGDVSVKTPAYSLDARSLVTLSLLDFREVIVITCSDTMWQLLSRFEEGSKEGTYVSESERNFRNCV